MAREREAVLSTRGTQTERALVRALAEAEGKSVCETIHQLLMPAVRKKLAELATEPEPAGR